MARRLRPLFVAILTLMFAGLPVAQQPSPTGRWRTYDDRTGEAKSIVVITENNGVLSGHIEKVFSPPAPNDHPTCKACTGELNEKPVIGMRIMWDMKKSGNEYTGGRLMDPENGKTYRGKVRLIDGGKKLDVRGFIGFSLLGRTQTWVRES
jgi:uncharacterized protein (DUF2147 family)